MAATDTTRQLHDARQLKRLRELRERTALTALRTAEREVRAAEEALQQRQQLMQRLQRPWPLPQSKSQLQLQFLPNPQLRIATPSCWLV